MSSSRNGLIGLGIGLGVAGAATAAGIVADRTHRRRQQALETGVSLVEKPSREVVVEATDGVALHVEVDEPRSGVALDEHGLPRPTVVMSHGYCLTSECWVFQRRYLRWAGSPRRRVGPARPRPVGSRRLLVLHDRPARAGPRLGHQGGRPRGAAGAGRPLDGRDDDDGARRLGPRRSSASGWSPSGRSRRRPEVCRSPRAVSRHRPAGSCWSASDLGWRASSSTGPSCSRAYSRRTRSSRSSSWSGTRSPRRYRAASSGSPRRCCSGRTSR